MKMYIKQRELCLIHSRNSIRLVPSLELCPIDNRSQALRCPTILGDRETASEDSVKGMLKITLALI